jgi:enamine deaminase RidA (YjgF/YER057c/UK114 family)
LILVGASLGRGRKTARESRPGGAHFLFNSQSIVQSAEVDACFFGICAGPTARKGRLPCCAAEGRKSDSKETARMKTLAPPSIRPPFARYAHGVEVPPGARLVVTSGQLGIGPDDRAPEGAEAQARLCFANCAAILAEAGMGPGDVIRINAFVTDRAHMAGYMAARDAWLAGVERLPASTLVIVAGFTRPEFLVEVEVTAAAP